MGRTSSILRAELLHIGMRLRWKTWLVVLCAAMMLVVTSAEASHFHHDDALPNAPISKPLSKGSGTHCLLCSSLHLPAMSSAVAVIGTPSFSVSLPNSFESHRSWQPEAFALFVRPPPSVA